MFLKKDEFTAEEEMMKYMEEKYQEEFTAGLCSTANWAYNYDSMTVYSDKFPNEFIQVYRYKNKEFKDNYMAYLFREEVEQLVHEIAEPLFGECKVFMDISDFPVDGDLGRDASLEDFLKNSSPLDQIMIYVQEFNPNYEYIEKLEKLSVQFKEKQLPRSLSILFLKPNNSLDNITRENENEILEQLDEDSWFIKDFSINLTTDYKIKEKDKSKLLVL